MPYLSQLSPTTQDLVLLSFEFFGKKFLLGIALLFSLFYVFYWYKKQAQTPYLFIGIVRTMLYMQSWITISLFPLMLFVLYPNIGLDLLLQWMLLFYSISFFIVGMIVFTNVLWYGGLMLFRLGGYEGDKKVNKVFDKTINWFLLAMGLRKVKLPKAITFSKNER